MFVVNKKKARNESDDNGGHGSTCKNSEKLNLLISHYTAHFLSDRTVLIQTVLNFYVATSFSLLLYLQRKFSAAFFWVLG